MPVVLGRLEDDAWRTIEQVARERQAPVFRIGEHFHTEGEESQQFSYGGVGMHYNGLTCVLAGRHQLDNAACALALLEAAAPQGIVITSEAARTGLQAVSWAGRLEVVDRRPTILFYWMVRIILLRQPPWPTFLYALTDCIRPAL